MTYICVAHRATATISLSAATDSGATVRVEAQVAAELVGAETGSVAWNSRYGIAFTAVVCRKPDKHEQRRLQNPSPFDTRKRDRAQTR